MQVEKSQQKIVQNFNKKTNPEIHSINQYVNCNNILKMEDHELFIISQELGIYRKQKIDNGTYGDVYKGLDEFNRRPIALKHIKDKYWVQQVKTMELMDHPNIVKYYGHVLDTEIPNQPNRQGAYIIMEYIQGKTLRDMLAEKEYQGRGLPQIMSAKIFFQLISGFSFIHSKGIVHRDVKPENILIDKNLNVKIIDLGQSKARNLMQTVNQGTPLYNAPEVFTDQNPQDFRRDVWSLGLVLYEILTGHFFFERFIEKHIQNMSITTLKNYILDRKIRIKLKKNLDPFWTEILGKMIKKNYKQRKNMHQIELIFNNQFDRLIRRIESKLLFKTVRQIKNPMLQTDLFSETKYMQRSDNHAKVSRLRNFMKYFYEKNRTFIMVGDLLTWKKFPFRYPFIPKILKIFITFLSYEMYLSSIKSMLGDLKNNVVKINSQEKYRITDFEEPYKSEIEKQIKHYQNFYEEEVEIFQLKIKEKILPAFQRQSFYKQIPIQMKNKNGSISLSRTRATKRLSENNVSSGVQDSMDRMDEYGKNLQENCDENYVPSILDEFPNILQLLQNYYSKTKLTRQRYHELYRAVVSSKYVHQRNKDLETYFYGGDLVIYYFMKVIAILDNHYRWEEVYKGSLIIEEDFKLSEQIEKEEFKNKLLSKILPLNYSKSEKSP